MKNVLYVTNSDSTTKRVNMNKSLGVKVFELVRWGYDEDTIEKSRLGP